jgi:hypothetical protein
MQAKYDREQQFYGSTLILSDVEGEEMALHRRNQRDARSRRNQLPSSARATDHERTSKMQPTI